MNCEEGSNANNAQNAKISKKVKNDYNAEKFKNAKNVKNDSNANFAKNAKIASNTRTARNDNGPKKPAKQKMQRM